MSELETEGKAAGGYLNGAIPDSHAVNSAVVGSSNADPVAAADSGVPSSAGEAESGGGDRPPRGGPGSGLPEWLAYAADHDIDVPEDASRDEVIAAVEAAEA